MAGIGQQLKTTLVSLRGMYQRIAFGSSPNGIARASRDFFFGATPILPPTFAARLDEFEARLDSGQYSFPDPQNLDSMFDTQLGQLRFPPSQVCRLLRRGEARLVGNRLVLDRDDWDEQRVAPIAPESIEPP